MQILITRHHQTRETIDGRLTIDGLHICDTAENVATALPPGTYPLRIAQCRQYARKMPVIPPPDTNPSTPGTCHSCKIHRCPTCHATLPRVCHMLKPGNGAYHRLDGSILVGTHICPGCLKRSREAFNTLYDRLRKRIGRGDEVTVKIIGGVGRKAGQPKV